ncbi:MAG: sigma-54-dependent Fis family transcriptional regulator [Desulfobacteraceae bacterium]|nr:sigma-54-dependent Fis family transcriptional regulator [Desulfobacteraceae bacterium]
MVAKVLVVDDEENMRHMLSSVLRHAGFHVKTAANGRQAFSKMESEFFDYILCDIRMPEMDGMKFLSATKKISNASTIIMMSAYGTIDLAIEALKLGAYDFISKPFKRDEVILTIRKAQERNQLKRENVQLKKRIKNIEEKYRFGSMVAKSQIMKAIFDLGEKVSQYNTTILIIGESGTGKELVARAIHNASPRSSNTLVPVNCGAIPETLLEAELFGYVKGAFTGADRNQKGLFEEAEDSTLFLDEIGELPVSLQVKLLRVLQENDIRPLGATQSKKVDVRVVAATSRDLKQMVKDGMFREDLYYRLNVLPIEIPSLRKRCEDIPLLCQYFISNFNKIFNRNVKGIAAEAMTVLLGYKWPGNVRELENAIERAIVLSTGDLLELEQFQQFFNPIDDDNGKESADVYSLKHAQKILEKEMIIKALKATNGNRTQASKLLQISHPSLLSKIKAYHIDL